MANEEAIELLDSAIEVARGEMALALLMAKQALEKQILKKPRYQYYEEDYWHVTTVYGTCPVCGKRVEKDRAHCQRCGQALDWSDKNGRKN